MLRELARSYLTVGKDLSRVMNRLKALYRSWAIPCAGRDVYYTRHRSQWLEKIPEAGTRRRAEQLYQQLDMLQHLRQQARRELLAESRRHTITASIQLEHGSVFGSAAVLRGSVQISRFVSEQSGGGIVSVQSSFGKAMQHGLLAAGIQLEHRPIAKCAAL